MRNDKPRRAKQGRVNANSKKEKERTRKQTKRKKERKQKERKQTKRKKAQKERKKKKTKETKARQEQRKIPAMSSPASAATNLLLPVTLIMPFRLLLLLPCLGEEDPPSAALRDESELVELELEPLSRE